MPEYADAVFDTQGDTHNLLFTVWGNVAGSRNQGELPPPDDPYWDDDSQTEGKIVETPEPDAENLTATTLFRRMDVLTFRPWSEPVNFCLDGLDNGHCPLGPVFSDIAPP